jgi:hypothetical protein
MEGIADHSAEAAALWDAPWQTHQEEEKENFDQVSFFRLPL